MGDIVLAGRLQLAGRGRLLAPLVELVALAHSVDDRGRGHKMILTQSWASIRFLFITHGRRPKSRGPTSSFVYCEKPSDKNILVYECIYLLPSSYCRGQQ